MSDSFNKAVDDAIAVPRAQKQRDTSDLFKKAVAAAVAVLRSIVERVPDEEKAAVEEQVGVLNALVKPSEVAGTIETLKKIAERASLPVSLDAWAETSSEATALRDEWFAICDAQNKSSHAVDLSEGVDAQGRKIFVIKTAMGHHWSTDSYDEAFFELVDAHRLGADAKGETRDLVWWADDDAHAHRVLAQIVHDVRDAMPKSNLEDRDAAVHKRLRALDAEEAARHGLEKASPAERHQRAAKAIAEKAPRLHAVREALSATVPLEKAIRQPGLANDATPKEKAT